MPKTMYVVGWPGQRATAPKNRHSGLYLNEGGKHSGVELQALLRRFFADHSVPMVAIQHMVYIERCLVPNPGIFLLFLCYCIFILLYSGQRTWFLIALIVSWDLIYGQLYWCIFIHVNGQMERITVENCFLLYWI